ncbi:MAG: hypothetical protein A2070_06240 [Bdellovibrionales bacterium GWC1_52_8]|nr:MAG: hypothetical protein A2070_06240 [Bdellovibrionales bacterium GWC1_52_8]
MIVRKAVVILLVLGLCVTGCRTTVALTNAAAPITMEKAVPGSITLRWDAPVANTDETPIRDLASYRIHYGTASGTYTETITNVTKAATSYTVAGLVSGTRYYFSIGAVNSSGVESDLAAELVKEAP